MTIREYVILSLCIAVANSAVVAFGAWLLLTTGGLPL